MIGDYDMDTPLGMNNGFYDEEYENWRKEHLQEITSNSAMSPRGAWFHYADLYDGYIYAIGEEQGNYAGGDISVEMNGEQAVRGYIDNKMSQSKDEYDISLYAKIKDYPVATIEMVRDMKATIQKYFDRNNE